MLCSKKNKWSAALQKESFSMKMTHARIVARDLPKLAGFYKEITGIAPVGTEDYVEFRTSSGTLALTSQRAMDQHGAGGATAAANHSSIVEFQVDDVDKERTRLKRIVPECVLEPTTQPWGNRSMLFRDPDGNLINFFQPINRGTFADLPNFEPKA